MGFKSNLLSFFTHLIILKLSPGSGHLNHFISLPSLEPSNCFLSHRIISRPPLRAVDLQAFAYLLGFWHQELCTCLSWVTPQVAWMRPPPRETCAHILLLPRVLPDALPPATLPHVQKGSAESPDTEARATPVFLLWASSLWGRCCSETGAGRRWIPLVLTLADSVFAKSPAS